MFMAANLASAKVGRFDLDQPVVATSLYGLVTQLG
jgi:hypothetical protein